MQKAVNQDLNKMQNGIKGFYRTRRFKLRVALCILLVIIICASAVLGVYFSRSFNGRVIFLCRTIGAYNHFYEYNPSLLNELDMTKDEFENKTAAKVIVGTSTVWHDNLIALGISGVDYDAALDMTIRQCYIILVDKKGEITYQGISVSDFLDALHEMRF